MREMTIHIRPAETEVGWMYDIYLKSPEEVAENDNDSEDGGLCTTTLHNALYMAVEQAKDVIIRNAIND